jgi:hypothetical protein
LKIGAANAAVELEAAQAEAVVEALQTRLWSGAFDLDAFLYGVALELDFVGGGAARRGDTAYASQPK